VKCLLKTNCVAAALPRAELTKKVGKVCQALLADRRTINEISEITSVSWSSCQHILTADLMMKQVTAK